MGKNAKIKVTAIVPSAGKGTRFRSKEKKPFAKLNGKPLLSYALKTLQHSPLIEDIVLVIDKSSYRVYDELIKRYRIKKVRHIVRGGRTRSDSIKKGLDCVDKDTALVLIHDGVRPFLSDRTIKETIVAAMRFGASVSAVPVKATIKVAGRNNLVRYTPNRESLWEVQTPQVFKKNLIDRAYREAYSQMRGGGDRLDDALTARSNAATTRLGKSGPSLRGFTDDAALLENIGRRVKIVRGDYSNIKITTLEDIAIAEALLQSKRK